MNHGSLGTGDAEWQGLWPESRGDVTWNKNSGLTSPCPLVYLILQNPGNWKTDSANVLMELSIQETFGLVIESFTATQMWSSESLGLIAYSTLLFVI